MKKKVKLAQEKLAQLDEFTREGQFLYSLTMYFLLAV